jgi:FtsH-binding integral membrane protein
MNVLTGRIGTFLLAVWLILYGVLPLLDLDEPSVNLVMAIIAIVAGIFILLDIRQRPSRNLGRLVLAIFLILMGIIQLLSITFPAQDTVMGIVAIVAGLLLLLGR